jgi:uncharacterized membrane protein YhaH (DUF805 family)
MTGYSSTGGPSALSAPYYGATFPIAAKRFWQKYATFSGRASRGEYWWWALVSGIVGVVMMSIYIPSLLAARTGGSGLQINAGIILVIVVGGLWFLATVVPTVALLWRRFHDANFSGWFFLLGLIPTVGWLFILIFTLLPSNPAGARFDQPAA